MVWVAWFALAVSLILLVYECRKDVLIRWVVGAFLVFLLADLLDRELALSPSPATIPGSSSCSQAAGSFAATIFVAGFPISVRRLTLIVRDATRSRDNECASSRPQNRAPIPSSSMTASSTMPAEISDFKFIFLNGNAERMIGMNRRQVLGKNLYEIFPRIRTTDHFERHKQVAETGEPALIEVTS